MSSLTNIPVVTIKLNKNNSFNLNKENNNVLDCKSNNKLEYKDSSSWETDQNEQKDEFKIVNRIPSQNNSLSICLNMNYNSSILEENSDDECKSSETENVKYKIKNKNNSSDSESNENVKIFLQKSSTVIEVKNVIDKKTIDESDEESSVSFNFKPPKKSSKINSSSDCISTKTNDTNNVSKDYLDETEIKKQFFIGKFQDIDEMLGNLFKMIEHTNQSLTTEELMEDFKEIEPSEVRVHDNKAISVKMQEYREEIDSSAVRIRENREFLAKLHELKEELDEVEIKQKTLPIKGELVKNKLEDCTFQLYKNPNSNKSKLEADYYGVYLDLESTIDELQEEFDGFHANRNNAILLRTQISVRVHTIIEKLLNSSGRELRRALFSLKQIFQVDKDLVHEFVQNDGLACLVKVGCEADQNHQNYILRALGQVMLYVDGMNGVINHNETIQWLYSLISSKFRLVVKTALKLLLVFVEYSDKNAKYLIKAINLVDSEQDVKPWYNLLCLLNEKELNDMELLILAMSLLNATLACLHDQDSYYDVVDSLEEQGMERIIQHYMSKQGIENDLLKQMHIYEAVLKFQDGDLDEKLDNLDHNVKNIINNKKQQNLNKTYLNNFKNGNNIFERRRSKRHALNCNLIKQNIKKKILIDFLPSWQKSVNKTTEQFSKRSLLNLTKIEQNLNCSLKDNETETTSFDELTPGLRKRLNERNNNEINNDNSNLTTNQFSSKQLVDNYNTKNQRASIASCSSLSSNISSSSNNSSSSGAYSLESQEEIKLNKNQQIDSNVNTSNGNLDDKKPWMFSMMYNKNEIKSDIKEDVVNTSSSLSTNKLVKNWQPITTTAIISTKEEISGSSIGVKNIKERILNGEEPKKPVLNYLRNTKRESNQANQIKETEYLHWEQLKFSLSRPLRINDLDFTDLKLEDDSDIFQINLMNGYDSNTLSIYKNDLNNQIPGPPPPPLPNLINDNNLKNNHQLLPPPPPPLFNSSKTVNKLTTASSLSTSKCSNLSSSSSISSSNYNSTFSPYSNRFDSLRSNSISKLSNNSSEYNSNYNIDKLSNSDFSTLNKSKKTLKLFWKEVKEDKGLLSRLKSKKTIWDEIENIKVDTARLEHLFENRTKELCNKKSNEGKKSELIILDTKRSNAINIGMTKLPPPRTIKTAILKMDATIMNREGIEKIFSTMMPTEEEKNKITEAQNANPDIPLGNAENFLLMLSSITALEARLKLWAFRLDYDIMEREIAEKLFDLKKAIEEIESSFTFKIILGTLRSIGNFLNGVDVKGFQIDYLIKVPEVKDTVHKHSLLYHLAHMIMEQYPKTTDFYSEIGSVTRASKVDYDELARNITKLETDCKSSWEHLKLIAKHDGNNQMKQKISEFLRDSAERIIILSVIQRRVSNRFKKLVVFLGANMNAAKEAKPQHILQIISEFSLEYRTTRERVKEQLEKKANFRERNKTRGKMITEAEKFRNNSLTHHASTSSLNCTFSKDLNQNNSNSILLSSNTHSNFISNSNKNTPKTNELKAEEQLRKILDKDTFETDSGSKSLSSKWFNLNGVKRRPSVPVSMFNQNQYLQSRSQSKINSTNGNLTDGDDEILESLVKTATTQTRLDNKKKTKSTRYMDRKSFRRTLKNDLNLTEEEKLILANMAKNNI